MNKGVKIGLGVAAVSAVGLLLFRVMPKTVQLVETVENVNVSLLNLPKIHKVDMSGIKIAVDLKVDNPAHGRLNLKIPQIKAYYNTGTSRVLVASTAVNNKTYVIEPVSSGKITGTMIEASFLSLLTSAPAIVNDMIAQGANIIHKLGFDVFAEVNGIPLKVQKL